MTYAQYGLIEASDYNTRETIIDGIWGPGSGSRGWGQPSLSSVNQNDIVTAGPSGSPVEWAKLIETLNYISVHENGTNTGITPPTTGDLITWLSAFDGQMNTLCDVGATNNRFGTYAAFNDQGEIAGTHSSAWGSGVSSITNIASVTWGSVDQARYFFNAGGRVNLNISYSGGSGSPQDSNWSTVCSTAGTMWLQALSVGGTASGSYGYYGSAGRMYSANGSGPYSTNTLTVDVSGQGTSSLTFTTVFTDNHTSGWFDQVTGTFRIGITVRRPTTNGPIADTWGLASVNVPNF